MSKPTMNTQDAVSANFAECFVTIDGTRYSMLMAKEFEGTASVNTAEVYKLGGVVVGHKAQTVALSFSMTIYKCTEIFDKVVEDFIKTGMTNRIEGGADLDGVISTLTDGFTEALLTAAEGVHA